MNKKFKIHKRKTRKIKYQNGYFDRLKNTGVIFNAIKDTCTWNLMEEFIQVLEDIDRTIGFTNRPKIPKIASE